MKSEGSIDLHDSTAADIAKRYGVSARHITTLAAGGEIPGIRVGKPWRFNADAVHAALCSHTASPFRSPRGPRRP